MCHHASSNEKFQQLKKKKKYLAEPVSRKERREQGYLCRVLVSVRNRFVVDERHAKDLALLLPTVSDQESR